MSGSVTTEDTLLLRIRRETKDLHERLESELDFPGSNLTLARYREVLGRFYGFYVSWEKRLEPGIVELRTAASELRPKLPDLIRDMEFFDIHWDALPLCQFVPACGTLPETIGSLYVREGSALGGQYISKQLQIILGLNHGLGYQFFSSAGKNVGSEWRQFQKLLLEHSSPENDDAIVASARKTFDSIRFWLCETGFTSAK